VEPTPCVLRAEILGRLLAELLAWLLASLLAGLHGDVGVGET